MDTSKGIGVAPGVDPNQKGFGGGGNAQAIQKPSLGRIVIYKDAGNQEVPAMITFVQKEAENIVCLTVFPVHGNPYSIQDARMGSGELTWHWPERV